MLSPAGAQTAPHTAAQPAILGDLVDVSEDFEKPDQLHFVARRVTQFDPTTGTGLDGLPIPVHEPSRRKLKQTANRRFPPLFSTIQG